MYSSIKLERKEVFKLIHGTYEKLGERLAFLQHKKNQTWKDVNEVRAIQEELYNV